MFFQRKIYPAVQKHLAQKQITVITGMRRVGKTTLLKQLLSEIPSKNKAYFDLERLDIRNVFTPANYDEVFMALQSRGLDIKKKIYLALDEIQLAPQIASVLKYLYDNYNIKFIVTGSSSFYLKNLFSESLAGRKKIFELFPLDFGEFLLFKGVVFQPKGADVFKGKFQKTEYERLKALYEDFIAFGGFPEVVLSKTAEAKKDLLNDIISSYINIDIAALSDFRQQSDFYSLLKMLALRIGNKLDYVKMSQLAGISRPTLMNYLEFLEKTYIIYRLPVFTKNLDREIVKTKKLYFYDSGLANVLAQLSSGQQFENTVFNQLKQYGQLKYYGLKNGKEIDFIVNGDIAVEAKETPVSSDLGDLAKTAKLAALKKRCLVGRHQSPHFQNYIWAGDLK